MEYVRAKVFNGIINANSKNKSTYFSKITNKLLQFLENITTVKGLIL